MKKFYAFIMSCIMITQLIIPSPLCAASNDDKVNSKLSATTLKFLISEDYTEVDVNKNVSFVPIKVFLDGVEIPITSRPFTYKGRVYLPLREVGETLKAQVGWNKEKKVAIVETETKRVEMPLGYRKAISIDKTQSTTSISDATTPTSGVRTKLYTSRQNLSPKYYVHNRSNDTSVKTLALDQTSMEVRTLLYDGKTYLPIRFTAETLGYDVKYVEASTSVYFTSKK